MCNNKNIDLDALVMGVLMVITTIAIIVAFHDKASLEEKSKKDMIEYAKTCRLLGRASVVNTNTFTDCLKMTKNQMYCADVVRNKIDAIAYDCVVTGF